MLSHLLYNEAAQECGIDLLFSCKNVGLIDSFPSSPLFSNWLIWWLELWLHLWRWSGIITAACCLIFLPHNYRHHCASRRTFSAAVPVLEFDTAMRHLEVVAWLLFRVVSWNLQTPKQMRDSRPLRGTWAVHLQINCELLEVDRDILGRHLLSILSLECETRREWILFFADCACWYFFLISF